MSTVNPTDPVESRYPIIAIDQLGTMDVLETISADQIIQDRMAKLVAIWRSYDPPAAAQYDVGNLEFDPIKITEELEAYFETLLRDRVNQAARACTLAFATGSDLDAIASRYPGGCPRLDDETDDRYRRRIWLSPNLLSPHGTFEAYTFWALTGDSTLRDATAKTIRGTGHIIITVMAEGSEPIPSLDQMEAARIYISSYSRQGLTDYVSVAPPKVIKTAIKARVWLFPGPDPDSTLATINANVAALVEKQRWLGYDMIRPVLAGVMSIPGVYDVVIDSPAETIRVDSDGLVQVTGIDVRYAGRGE